MTGTNGTVTGTVTVSATPVAGGTVQLISGGTTVTAIPNGSGVYSFTNVAPGAWTVTNQPPLAYSVNDAGTFDVTVSSGGTTTQNFSVRAALYSDDFSEINQ